MGIFNIMKLFFLINNKYCNGLKTTVIQSFFIIIENRQFYLFIVKLTMYLNFYELLLCRIKKLFFLKFCSQINVLLLNKNAAKYKIIFKMYLIECAFKYF